MEHVGPGTSLEGRYVLVDVLGRGGMGTVWRAEHASLGTAVAVKLMEPRLATNPEGLARFRREARLAATLDSPHVVRVTDFGVHAGTPYIVMELLQGETLRARLDRTGALPLPEVARIAQQLARGIACAHAAQIVHRDLKPENVFLARVSDDELVKVLDFGVAKASSLAHDPLTRTGVVLGTLRYMSPEQLEGSRNVTLASDLWAFAVILFECLCGRPAFAAEAMTDLVRDICLGPPPVPSRYAPVSGAVDAWFARAVSRDPAMRFEGARAMADALESALAARERASVPPSGSATMDAAEIAWTKPLPAQEAAKIAERARERAAAAAPQISPPEPTPVWRRGGSERAGYELTPDRANRMLVLKFWGLWDLPLAQAFREDVLRAYDAMAGAPWVSLSLSQAYPALKPGTHAIHTDVMVAGARKGMRRVAVIVSSALSQMQIRRLFEESGGNPHVRFFQDEAEGRAWLASQMSQLDPH